MAWRCLPQAILRAEVVIELKFRVTSVPSLWSSLRVNLPWTMGYHLLRPHTFSLLTANTLFLLLQLQEAI